MTDDRRKRVRANTLADEATAVTSLVETLALSMPERRLISATATRLVTRIRRDGHPGIMETFLGEYGLSTDEGVALMCLAEALLRVPDTETIDALIQDKIAPADWGRHLGHSSSSLVNASTWALMLTGQVLKEDTNPGIVATLHDVVRRLGEPVVRSAVSRIMREMGRQFVLGQDIRAAMDRGKAAEQRGFTYSYDMLGEAARTEHDACRYHLAYAGAIGEIAAACTGDDIRVNPGISVKLSALHCRYEFAQRAHVMPEMVARLGSLSSLAKSAGMGLNIDAEEADRLDIMLDIVEQALADPALAGWDGFGVVVQAYSKSAPFVLDWLHDLAVRLDRRLTVRLVKGAYWDSEIKRAQVLGLTDFPVFTRKINTDISYLACARKLFGMTDRIYPQFATHNAHTVAAVLAMAGDRDRADFEFQRLHGMGEALHDAVMAANGTRCRIYAPVGAHEDLLAYLVRRLLENGANSSFVNQIVDSSIRPEDVAADPVEAVASLSHALRHPRIVLPPALFAPGRKNARGWDLTDPQTVGELEAAREPFRTATWSAVPMIAGVAHTGGRVRVVYNPYAPGDRVGKVRDASGDDVDAACRAARAYFPTWAAWPAYKRADALRRAANLYELHAPEFMALAGREAGKTLADGIAEVREAVDFLRYYATEAERLESTEAGGPRGVFACISPWNFPLAIFIGPVAAALATGNVVIAKPAEQTCLIAARAVEIMHEAGIPAGALQLVPGDGPSVGAALVSNPCLAGVCFTGSTETAQAINRAMAANADPSAPLIAETGGLNAMIVDSTALTEQAVRDIVISAFQSAGQRCSAARILYVQKDVEERTLAMLKGAMAALRVGDPWDLSSDLGPVIDSDAYQVLMDFIGARKRAGDVIASVSMDGAPEGSYVVPPTLIRATGIDALEGELFGPVLHVATFEANDLGKVVADINRRRYGLTLGLHTRVDQRMQYVVSTARVGNIYINRNQIGAVVNAQPFGGEGLSGTGPKAGGPLYVRRFRRLAAGIVADVEPGEVDLPGPTGESNRYRIAARGRMICVGDLETPDGGEALHRQLDVAGRLGNHVVDGAGLAIDDIAAQDEVAGVMATGDLERLATLRRALAARDGPIVPLITDPTDVCPLVSERTLCIDTTAAGGNATLLATVAG